MTGNTSERERERGSLLRLQLLLALEKTTARILARITISDVLFVIRPKYRLADAG